jgi:hypothetical protein
MKPDKNMKLADLMYGHGDKFMCTLSGQVNFDKYRDAPPIQICEMKCGCWIVVDGNNRIGLILKATPDARISDIPSSLLATFRFGKWDSEMMDWWNPCAKSFRDVMSKRDKKTPEPKNAIYGVIERHENGKFFACTVSVKNKAAIFATGRTANEAKWLLAEKLKLLLKRVSVALVLTPMNSLEEHQCGLLRPAEKCGL